jgi:hypothetical protein
VEKEKLDQHPISEAMKAFAGAQSVEACCEQLLRSIAKRHFEIMDSPRAKLTAFLSRHFPGLMRQIGNSIIQSTQRKMVRR